MRLWPSYKLDDIANLTPESIIWHLENGCEPDPDVITFQTMEQVERWRAKTMS